jgi:hypothetical protein
LAVSVPVAAGGGSATETFTGTVVPIGPVAPAVPIQFTLYIDSYCTDEEKQALVQALVSEGKQGLLNGLRKMKKGRIVIGPQTGYTINAAVSIPTATGRRIRAVTERPIAMPELYFGTRSRDYKFGFLEIVIEGDGKGSGILVFAGDIDVPENGTVELENFGIDPPARLVGIKQR